MNPDHLHLSILSQAFKWDPNLLKQWFNDLGSFEAITTNPKLQQELGLENNNIARLKTLLNELPISKISEVATKQTIFSVSVLDDKYPKLLKQIHDPPAVLYYRGALPEEDQICVAVVGNRRMTQYGKYCVEKIVTQLIANNVSVISGLAYGIDAESHKTSVGKNSKTFGVIGSGVDDETFYPSGNLRLAHSILEKAGGIISEYPPLTTARKYHFVARNRIISGLSQASVIIECRSKSGALITADFALEQNRLLYAVPGPINSESSTGPNKLIQQGAGLLLDATELLLELGIETRTNLEEQNLPHHNFTPSEQVIIKHLQTNPEQNSFDELITKLDLPYSELAITLNKLELAEVISRSETGTFYIKPL